MQENLNICLKIIKMENLEEKLSTIYLVSGQTALQYLMNVSKKYRQIATEAIFECLRLGYPPQRHGNIRQSSRAAEEEECNRLK